MYSPQKMSLPGLLWKGEHIDYGHLPTSKAATFGFQKTSFCHDRELPKMI